MTMTDPIADMLTRLRNASAAKHETVDMPYSKFKANIAEILKREGYIKDFTAKEAKVGQTLEVTLKYGPNGERSIQGIKRISKPGLRRYGDLLDSECALRELSDSVCRYPGRSCGPDGVVPFCQDSRVGE